MKPSPKPPFDLRALLSQWPEYSAIGVFAALVAWAVPNHEPWADEAQAWQLARSLPLVELFQHRIRYEGSPGLWHLLLWIMVRLHVTYAGMHWICGAIAVLSTALLVLGSPFPRYLKLTLPFTFFLLFQYAVVARNYVLAPPLLFLAALWWKSRPILAAVALGLLANVSLHAAAIAGGLAIALCVERLQQGDWRDPQRRRALLLAAIVLLCFCSAALWTAWPPRDIGQHLAAMRQIAPPRLVLILVSFLLPIAQPLVLALLIWIGIVASLHARQRLVLLIPVLLFIACNGAVASNYWHFGLLVPLLLAILWMSWPIGPATGAKSARSEALGRIALCCMAAVQIAWAGFAMQYDHNRAFSPDLAAAQLLRPQVDAGARIAITNLGGPDEYVSTAVGILPYFRSNIFLNLAQPYYGWEDNDPTERRYVEALLTHPNIVVVEAQQAQLGASFNLNYPRIQALTASGYRWTNSFCGSMPFRTAPIPNYCHLIFRYAGAPE